MPRDTIRSKLKSALTRDIQQEPQAPAPSFQSWTAPDSSRTPSEADQRNEGARALANAQPPQAPVYYEQHVTGGGS